MLSYVCLVPLGTIPIFEITIWHSNISEGFHKFYHEAFEGLEGMET